MTTSHASQGKTVDRVLIAMGRRVRPAINAEQFYVSVSRGREQATIYTNMKPAELREAIQRSDPSESRRRSCWGQAEAEAAGGLPSLAEKMRTAFRQLREKAADAMSVERKREREHVRAR